MFAGRDAQIFELLAESETVARTRLTEARAEQQATDTPLATVLVERGLIAREGLLRAVAAWVDAEFVAELPATLTPDSLALLPAKIARRFGVAPLQMEAGVVRLLAADPFDPHLSDDLAFALDRPVRLVVADPARIVALIRQYYGDAEGGATELLSGSITSVEPHEADLAALAAQEPIIRFVDTVLTQAVCDRASDVHFEPFEEEFRIRCRIDGALLELPRPPRTTAPAVISRLKVLANLNIAERRLPQDGRIRLNVGGRAVDLRISTLPTQCGESVVLRVLDRSAVRLDLGELGLPAPVHAEVERVIRQPHGIFIVTGPTGSGKTTTLYSCLQQLNAPDAKVLTVEDPVEYEIEGVMQVPINPAAGLTFASALRSFLRHDPDIVMVGEIRDLETAQIAIQAALTGHLVLTTLHTNDAAGAITRLVEMGVEPFLLASTVEAVLAQRLVRRICPDCREECRPPATLSERAEFPADWDAGQIFQQGAGCPQCRQTGYRGRRGIFELLVVDNPLREFINRGISHEELRRAAVGRGMRLLREDGLRLVAEGQTTLEELLKLI